ncbi:hypothetical protein [Brucella pseudogrignonensis]|uniref:hypothetical protein n=1 Tax=Brucella pseudogrignonensis TaxID=419475 RepID=UPI003D995322
MNDDDAILASVYTRWHQLAVPLSLITSAACFLFVTLNRGPIMLAGVLALVALVVPPLIAFKAFPTRNRIKVMPDGLQFSRRAPIAFVELSGWGTDDFLKLVRPGYPTLLVSPLDVPGRERLLREFKTALDDWQQRHPERRAAAKSHFYGTVRARLIGMLICILGAGISIMALNMHSPSIELALVGGLGALFGLWMLSRRKKEAETQERG